MVDRGIKLKTQITDDAIKQSFGMDSYGKGTKYQEQGMVIEGVVDPSGMLLSGVVRGKSYPRYHVTIKIEKYTLTGNCSCPVSDSCKHCAALCLEWLRNPSGFRTGEVKASPETSTSDAGEDEEFDDIDEDDDADGLDASEDGGETEADDGDEDAYSDDGESGDEDDPDDDEFGEEETVQVLGDLEIGPVLPEKEIFNAISPDHLILWFHESWQRRYPAAWTPFFQGGSYMKAWEQVISRIDYYEPPRTGSYDTSAEVNEGTTFAADMPFSDWISPLDLLQLIGTRDMVQRLLKAWFIEYVHLGACIKQEFRDRGLLKGSYKALFVYYEEFIKQIVQEEEPDADDYYYRQNHRYDDGDRDEYEVGDSEVVAFTENFLKRITLPLVEIARYANELASSGLARHAAHVKDKVLGWVMSLPEKTAKPWSKLAPRVAVLKAAIQEAFDQQRINNLSTGERVTYRVAELIRLPTEESADRIAIDCRRASDPRAVTTLYHEAIAKEFPRKTDPYVGRCWISIVQLHAPDLLGIALDAIGSRIGAPGLLEGIEHEFYKALGEMPPDYITRIQGPLIDQIKSLKKDKYLRDLAVEDGLRWFIRYFSSRGPSSDLIEVYRSLATMAPKSFTRNDFNGLEKCLDVANVDTGNEILAFVEQLKSHGSLEELVPVMIAKKLYTAALQLVVNRGNESSWEKHLHTILLGNPALDAATSDRLIEKLQKKVSTMVRRAASSRHDYAIADFLDCGRILSTSPPRADAEKAWQKWFKAFWNEYKSLRNLRKALESRNLL